MWLEWRHDDVITKNNGNNGKMQTLAEPNKIYIVRKVLMRAIQKCNFYWISTTVSIVMGIYVKFTITTHQIWSCHMTLALNSENFYFSPNCVSNVRKTYQIRCKLAENQKLQPKNKLGVGKHSLPPITFDSMTLMLPEIKIWSNSFQRCRKKGW